MRTPNKYMDTQEREKLLTRLVQSHDPGADGPSDRGREEHELSASDMIEGVDGAEDTLYYASDLAATVPRGSQALSHPHPYGEGDNGLFDLPDGFAIKQQIFVDEKPDWYDIAQASPMKTGAEVIAEAKAAGFSFD